MSAGQGKEPRAWRGPWLWCAHLRSSQRVSSLPAGWQSRDPSQPRTDQLPGQQVGLKQPKSTDQKDKPGGGGEIPQQSPDLMGTVPVPPENSQGRVVLGTGWG